MNRFLSWGMYNFDHMTGFIGPFGTGILNVYWNVLLIGNFIFYLISKRRKWLYLFFLQALLMIILSFFNENKSFIPTCILFLCLFISYIFVNKNFSIKSFFKLVTLFFSIVIIMTLLYKSFPSIQELMDKILEAGEQFSSGASLDTNNERAYLNYLAFKYYGGSSTGIGINTVDFNNQSIHKNLGINSFSLILIHGGVWYFIGVVQLYVTLSIISIKAKFNFQWFYLYIIFVIAFCYLSIITQPFRDHYTMFMLSMLVLFLSVFQKYREQPN
ncbi:hypothetical protein NLI92_004977 [Priestia megaterium]|uniref:hypothetical protein n=1 Tax=Priestia megaterium TaxID=1404 RepID=UPI0021AC0BBF|nr:hypothetical protein [Priestia megaterium]MCR8929538.1 hypothetical protein [Priestia megaterium]